MLPRPWPKSAVYPGLGALLALGAPIGLVLLRTALAGRLSASGIASELSRDALTYGYVTVSTLVVFVVMGIITGRGADKLTESAATDPLTGLANRRHFDRRLLVELERGRRYRSDLALLLIDVDYLKRINDEHGHRAGDSALKWVARALDVSCRASDVVARWGGDEFTVLAPGVNAEEARALASRVRETLQRQPPPEWGKTTVSIGIADANDGVTPEALYTAADSALYQAKMAGRDRAVVYTGRSPARASSSNA